MDKWIMWAGLVLGVVIICYFLSRPANKPEGGVVYD